MAETRTKEELRAAWVAALRSGEYKQGQYALCTRDGNYCCLGVAGKVIGLSDEELKVWKTKVENLNAYERIQSTFGLSDVMGGYDEGQLYFHNDSQDHGLNFSQIADIIEAKPEGLFID